jgi:phage gpG-like protein
VAFEFTIGKFQQGEGLENALANPEQIVNAVALAQVGTLKSAFLVGGHGDRGGEQWAPWSPKYARNRARKGRSKVLVDKGILRNSVHASQATPGPDYVVMIGSNVPYAKVHQFGFTGNVTRKAFAQNDVRARGKWVAGKDGVERFKKGRKQAGSWRHFEEWKGVMTIPARPFLVVTQPDADKARERIVRWADFALNGPGGAAGQLGGA